MSKILIVEDDKAIIKLLEIALKVNGYEPIVAENGIDGIKKFLGDKPDIILLDLGLPDISGIEVLEQIRDLSSVPVIVVSARDKEKEKVEALDNGADDYVTKPFNLNELLARIRVALRKVGNAPKTLDSYVKIKDLEVDFEKRKITLNGDELHFTPIEFKLLKLLITNKGKVLTHQYIQKNVWGYDSDDDYQSLRVFMANIRKKIEKDTNNPNYILTEIGVGYRFVEEE